MSADSLPVILRLRVTSIAYEADAVTRDMTASGRWLTVAGWESNPLDFIEAFQLLT